VTAGVSSALSPKSLRPETLWPETLWLVRHGESAANLASRTAEHAGALEVPLPHRDMDTPLTDAGKAQAEALGKSFIHQIKPQVIIVSPYARTRETTAAFCAAFTEADQPELRFDERLRERERGVFDGLTVAGVKERLPYEFDKRHFLGKFYHRAPGGESWCDVVQRLRAVVDRVLIQHAGQRVMIITHEVVIYCLRYILEDMDEAQILAVDAAGDIANCSVTEYRADAHTGRLVLKRFNVVG
jgi:ribonuclease H / adenosylcobalamin/alpha-ribazole phosphatase